MTDLRISAQQALEALKMMRDKYEEYACPACDHADAAIYALKAALVEDALQKFTDVNQELEAALKAPVQEPVAWSFELAMTRGEHGYADWSGRRVTQFKPNVPEGSIRNLTPLYTSPPQRKPLSEEAIYRLFVRSGLGAYHQKDFVVQTEYDRCVEAFARAIERAHGIGGQP